MLKRRERLKSALSLKLRKRSFYIVKGGPFGLFENPVCCKKIEKIEGDPLETLKKFETSHRAKRGGESLIVPQKFGKGSH